MNNFSSTVKLLLSKFNRSSISEIGWIITGHTITVILSFLIIKILSGMGAENYGVYVLVITLTAFLGIIYGPLQQAFIRFYYDYLNKNLIRQYLKLIFKYLLMLSLIFLIIIAISGSLYLSFGDLAEPAIFFVLSGIYIILYKINEFFNSALNIIRKRKENAILQGLEKFFIITGLFLFLQQDNLTLTNVFIVLNVSVILFLLLKAFTFIKHIPAASERTFALNEQKEIKKTLLKYSTPFLIWASAAWLQLNGEKWIINEILSTYDVGVYAIMLMIVNAFIAIPNTILTEFITPIIFKQYSDVNNRENIAEGRNYIKITIAAIAFLTLIATVITYFWGEELIILISNDSYTIYKYLLPVLCLGTGLFYTGQAQTLLGMALNKPKEYIAPKVSSGILSVFLNFLLMKFFGIDGIAYSILIIGLFYIVYISFVNKNFIKVIPKQ